MEGLRWTKERPTQPGYYWNRYRGTKQAERIVEVIPGPRSSLRVRTESALLSLDAFRVGEFE